MEYQRACRCWSVLLLGAALAGVVVAPAAADRRFDERFAKNDTGDIAMAANTLMSCQTSDDDCADARSDGGNNNSFDMDYVDVDGDAATFNSSSAELQRCAGAIVVACVPDDATVLFAGLYWSANTTDGDDGEDAPNPSARNAVRLATPGGAYAAVTASELDEAEQGSQTGAYSAFADVTDRVQAGRAGTYRVANVQAGTGEDRYAGWALVVAFHSPTGEPRNLFVMDGFVTINSGSGGVEGSISGFRAPPSGEVAARLGFVANEGDRDLGGDRATFNDEPLSDSEPGSDSNFFDSTVSRLGADVATKAPNYDNNLGFDADVVDGDGKIENNATSASVRLSTDSDTYLPSVAWTAIDLYSPDVESTKSVSDLNGGLVEAGDELEYTISGSNEGEDTAANVTVSDLVPANTAFVPGSLRITGGAGTGTYTDAEGDDRAEFQAGAGLVVFRVGTNANAIVGGSLAPEASYEVRYRARVAAGLPGGTKIVNQARVRFLGTQVPDVPYDRPTNETELTTRAPDLAIDKAFSGTVILGATGTYTLTVSNVGDAPSRGTVTVSDPLFDPALFAVNAVGGDGWACAPPPGVNCTRSDSLAPGTSYPPITITGTFGAPPPGGLVNTATVAGGGDTNESNNKDTVAPPNAPVSSLAIEKQVTADRLTPGEAFEYVLVVKNTGTGVVDPVLVSDPVPAGVTVVSVTPEQGSCDTTVSCNLGALAPGATTRVRISARVALLAAPGPIANTGRVSGPNPDPSPEDNEDSAVIDVRVTANLRLTKRLQGSATAGETVRWNVTVRNLGPHGSPAGAKLADLVPAVVTNPRGSVPGGTCRTVRRLVGCALPAIPVGARVQITVTGTLRADSAGATLNNGAFVQPPVAPPQVTPLTPGLPPQVTPPSPPPPSPPGGGSPPGSVVGPAADIGVAKVVDAGPVDRNGVATYTMRVTNHGPSRATNVQIRDTLPPGARFLRSRPAGRCTASGQTVTCELGTMSVGQVIDTRILVRLASSDSARLLINRVTVDGNEVDPATANNRALSLARLAPNVTLSKSVSARTARVGDRVSYTLRVTNRGPGTARSVRLCDIPGPGLRVRRAEGARRQGQRWCWNIGTLRRGAGARREIVFAVSAANRPTRLNLATVSVERSLLALRRARLAVQGAGGPPGVTG